LQDVLVIDDSDPDLLFARVIIERAAVAERVLTFGTGPDALAHLQGPESARCAVVLLDINMPEMNGFQFLEAYAPLHAARRCTAPVVMLTSSSDPGDRARARAYPCVAGYLVKPIDVASAKGLAQLAGACSAS
jgi:CheY-like chemotaxis protein